MLLIRADYFSAWAEERKTPEQRVLRPLFIAPPGPHTVQIKTAPDSLHARDLNTDRL